MEEVGGRGVGGDSGFLTRREVAERLKISERHLDSMVKAGRVPCVRFGRAVRFYWNDVVATLRGPEVV
jgi:excisionase family DNA binding protein